MLFIRNYQFIKSTKIHKKKRIKKAAKHFELPFILFIGLFFSLSK